MKSDKVKFLMCLLFFTVLALLTFRCAWPADMVFSASDMNIGRLAVKKSVLPESFTGVFYTSPVMGNNGSGFALFNILLTLVPLKLFANTFYGFFLVSGSLSMVWFLRMWRRSWCASVLGALIAFWVNSIMLAAGGHAYKVEVLVLAVLSLCFIEKAVRAGSSRIAAGYAIVAGLCVGFTMIEQQDVALLAGLLTGPYALFRLVQVHKTACIRWVAVLLPIAVVALLLSGSTLITSYKQNIAGAAAVQKGTDGNTDSKWNYITQWSMVPGEWPDLIAPGWGGWASNDPKGPYWGIMGQSAEWESTGQGFRNFKITSKYIGIIPFLIGFFGLVGAVKCRKGNDDAPTVLFWSVAGILTFWLSFGKFSVLYKLFFNLPLLGNIRDQSKFLDLFQLCIGIVAAFGLDWLIGIAQEQRGGKKPAKWLFISGSVLAVMMLIAGLKYLVLPDAQASLFTKMGFGAYAEVMVKNMSSAWFHGAVLSGICGGLGYAIWKGGTQVRWIVMVFVAIAAVDSLLLTSKYFKADNIAALERGNGLINYLKENQENERIFFVDKSGIYNQWLASDGPFHELNLFNIWQMPRMPVEYKEYLGKVGRNQIRLWELSSIKYVAAPASIMEQLKQQPQLSALFAPAMNYQVPTAQGMRQDVLLEFKGAIPRLALFTSWNVQPLDKHCEILASPKHNAKTTVLAVADSGLSAALGTEPFLPLGGRITKKSASVDVKTDRPALVRFSQRYKAGWRVYIDGKKADLIKLDYLCMGVKVPAGEHQVVFKCGGGGAKLIKVMVTIIVSVLAAYVLIKRESDLKA